MIRRPEPEKEMKGTTAHAVGLQMKNMLNPPIANNSHGTYELEKTIVHGYYRKQTRSRNIY